MKTTVFITVIVICVTAVCLAAIYDSINLISKGDEKLERLLIVRLLPVKEWYWDTETFECIPYVVKDDDTLWDIAVRYYPNQRKDKMIWAIRRASGLEDKDGALLMPGQVIWIPDPELYK